MLEWEKIRFVNETRWMFPIHSYNYTVSDFMDSFFISAIYTPIEYKPMREKKKKQTKSSNVDFSWEHTHTHIRSPYGMRISFIHAKKSLYLRFGCKYWMDVRKSHQTRAYDRAALKTKLVFSFQWSLKCRIYQLRPHGLLPKWIFSTSKSSKFLKL